ncbi:hypothetical protein ABIA33_002975 [Streptacidiphilus sp. MAP12-16]|uniref:hypothetical protein n=1 Tax=Streptacidiphilus sp. MAP12-16 TaxID=3156300 RepID=UPI0035160F28
MPNLKITIAVLVCAGSALATAACGPASVSEALVASARPTASPAATTVPVILDCLSHSQVRPTTYVLACGDGNNYLVALHWSQWGTKSARALGTDEANDCVPYCAAGRFHGYPVDVLLDRAQPWKGHPGVLRFTRITLDYPANRPAGIPKQTSFNLPAGPA